MDNMSASEAARRLGTSLPRVVRAIERLGLDVERRDGGRVLLTEAHLERLKEQLGFTPPVDRLSRLETKVLAELARAPRGLASLRALARRAGVSPTSASRAVRSLALKGLVRRDLEWVAAGRAREVELIRPNVTARGWAPLARRLAAARPVERKARATLGPRHGGVPARLRHLFWNVDPGQIDLRRHGGYVAERLISAGDLDGLAWGIGALQTDDWESAARNRGLSPEKRALARNIARRGRR